MHCNTCTKTHQVIEQTWCFFQPSDVGTGLAAEPDHMEGISEGELVTSSDTERQLESEVIPSGKNSLRETLRGVWSYMGWRFIPDFDLDHPWPCDHPHPPGKVFRLLD